MFVVGITWLPGIATIVVSVGTAIAWRAHPLSACRSGRRRADRRRDLRRRLATYDVRGRCAPAGPGRRTRGRRLARRASARLPARRSLWWADSPAAGTTCSRASPWCWGSSGGRPSALSGRCRGDSRWATRQEPREPRQSRSPHSRGCCCCGGWRSAPACECAEKGRRARSRAAASDCSGGCRPRPPGRLLARSLIYWFRDGRQARQLILLPVLPALMLLWWYLFDLDWIAMATGPVVASLLPLSAFAALSYDGTAFAAELAAGVRGVHDRLGRALAILIIAGPATVAGADRRRHRRRASRGSARPPRPLVSASCWSQSAS